jgi:acyl-CoA synthetase (AMP-forming)/AMP-acid ligase II
MEDIASLSVGQVLEKGAHSVPDKIAVKDGEQGKTYKELNHMADSLAAILAKMGFTKGDRVAIYMPNSLELMAAFYALQKLGIIVVWVNSLYRKTEAEFILENSGAKGIFIFSEWAGYEYLDSISDIKKDLPGLESIITVGKGEGRGVYQFHELLTRGAHETYTSPPIDTREDLAMLLYTSGTTGKPKGAMIGHYAAVRAGWEYSLGVNGGSEDIFLGALPMSHSYGCGAVLIQPLLLHATVVLMNKFDAEGAFKRIEKENITQFPGAPTHYILMLNHKERKNYDLSSLKAGLIAGYIPPEGLITRVEREMGVYLTNFWGASEVGPGVGIMCPYPLSLEMRENYVGLPVADTEIRIVDPETGKELPDGEIGELTLRGWHMMKGYWRNPEETQRQIVDGWLFMGDLASRERDGYFKIYARTKDLINRGGFKIYPSELESLIIEHPKVEEVCVVATPNPVLGENICVCVVPKMDEKVTLSEIREFLNGKVAPHKLPDELCSINEFPRLSGGVKINKFGKGGLVELAVRDQNRERFRK